MNVNVSIAKIKAWIMPTNISRNIKGIGTKYGTKNAMTRSKTSPAKILPKSLKEKETTFMASEIISKKPVINSIGLLKFINLAVYPRHPRNFIE